MNAWSSMWLRKKKEEGSKALSLFDLLAVGIGGSLAFGIWVLVGHLIRNVVGPAVVISICLAGAAALAGGLCFAEFAVRFLKADSTYIYSYLDSDQNGAFVFGWAVLLQYIAGAASGAKGVVAFVDSLMEYKISDFLSRVTPLFDHDAFRHFDFITLIVVTSIVIFMAFGMKNSISVKKIFTTFNIILIVTVVVAGAFKADLKNWYLEETSSDDDVNTKFTPFGLLGVAKGATMAFYGFLGFDTVSTSGNEVKKRKIVVPLAISVTILFSIVAYAGVGTILTLMMPYSKHDSHAAVPFAFQLTEWIVLKWIVVIATFFSFYTSLFGATFAIPRILSSMANDGLLFPFLGDQKHKKQRKPIAAILTSGLLATLAAGFLPFEELVNVAVLAALFVFIYFATHLILLRYYPSSSNVTECSSGSCFMTGKNSNCDISVKSLMRSFFNVTEKFPNNITKKIIIGNIISFYLSSIGITIIFKIFHEPLIDYTVEALVPAGVLLCILFLNVISITCQPKSEENVSFKVPLVPLVPCLSIFLNIFLMQSFELLTWILFFSWFALGVVPYSVWRCVKHFRKDYGENSLYEINRSNAIKLNESIWKIKSNKKSFYEGALNPVFLNDDDIYVYGNGNKNLEQIEKISDEERKTKLVENQLQLKFAHTEHEEIENESSELENVRWECVAEIHEEVELPAETTALEIVDNTYKFLSEISKNDRLQATGEDSNTPKSETSSSGSNENLQYSKEKPEQMQFKEELFIKIKSRLQRTNYTEITDETQNVENNKYVSSPKTDDYSNNNPNPQELIPDEENKVKQFKEKLNQLLKNQINSGTTFTKNSKLSNADDDKNRQESSDEKDKNILHNSLKTLNKSQIKRKLEFLLSKGPPKRSALGSSFNIKITETGDEIESKESEEEKNNGQNTQFTND